MRFQDIAFVPNGNSLAFAANGNDAMVWDLETKVALRLSGHTDRVTSGLSARMGSGWQRAVLMALCGYGIR